MKYMAQQVKVDAGDLVAYDWSGRTIKYHRAQIREAHGFREATRADEDHLAAWLSEEVCPVEPSEDRLREALLARCRAERIEPPGRLDRVLAAAGAAFDKRFCTEVVVRLSPKTRARLEELIGDGADGSAPAVGRRAPWPACAGCERRRSPTPSSTSSSAWCTRSTPGPSAASKAS